MPHPRSNKYCRFVDEFVNEWLTGDEFVDEFVAEPPFSRTVFSLTPHPPPPTPNPTPPPTKSNQNLRYLACAKIWKEPCNSERRPPFGTLVTTKNDRDASFWNSVYSKHWTEENRQHVGDESGIDSYAACRIHAPHASLVRAAYPLAAGATE